MNFFQVQKCPCLRKGQDPQSPIIGNNTKGHEATLFGHCIVNYSGSGNFFPRQCRVRRQANTQWSNKQSPKTQRLIIIAIEFWLTSQINAISGGRWGGIGAVHDNVVGRSPVYRLLKIGSFHAVVLPASMYHLKGPGIIQVAQRGRHAPLTAMMRQFHILFHISFQRSHFQVQGSQKNGVYQGAQGGERHLVNIQLVPAMEF